MNETLTLALASIAGGLLGVVFFGGLWWTVRRGTASEHPGLWFTTSLFVRMGITMGGFYWVSGAHWDRLLACLVGFVMASGLVTLLSRTREPARGRSAEEVVRASHSR